MKRTLIEERNPRTPEGGGRSAPSREEIAALGLRAKCDSIAVAAIAVLLLVAAGALAGLIHG